MNDNEKNTSILSVILKTVGFLFGAFLIFKLINEGNNNDEVKKELEVEEKGEITPKAAKDEVRKMGKIKKKIYPINERQYQILAEIKEKGQLEPSEIYTLQPNVSTRTLRRDMDVLVAQGVVKQEGNTKSTKYTYIG